MERSGVLILATAAFSLTLGSCAPEGERQEEAGEVEVVAEGLGGLVDSGEAEVAPTLQPTEASVDTEEPEAPRGRGFASPEAERTVFLIHDGSEEWPEPADR